jgi:hypothetical protein
MANPAKVVIVARLEGRCAHCDGLIEPELHYDGDY